MLPGWPNRNNKLGGGGGGEGQEQEQEEGSRERLKHGLWNTGELISFAVQDDS